MSTDVEHLRAYLTSFDLRGLFVEGLGWDYPGSGDVSVRRDGCNYVLTPLAEKSDFAVFECGPRADGEIPPYPMRRKIETGAVRVAYEHLILFVNASRSELILQWIKRTPGAPPTCQEFSFQAGQPGTSLLQRLATIAFELEEQEGLGIGEVVRRVKRAMHAEKVTKAFYSRFRCELETFQGFIRGMRAEGDRAWYASLMLNRMMFIYFIQKQGFLDRDPHYLRNRLETIRASHGSDQFHGFYRLFLRRLFHEGLGQPEARRAPELAELLGTVPFLNGGLFELHDLERDNPDLDIPDEAFERVFGFFDQYRWHLDERPKQDDNEINPDVLGYIFEKYINQKQMGAYYTREDITGYITRNTLLPFLFQAAEKKCRVAFQPGGGVWRLLRDDPDRYIYPATAHGMAWRYAPDAEPHRLEQEVPLPPEIAAGLEDPSGRQSWNQRADDPAAALPTETWREVAGRRRRYQQVRARLASGEVADIDECVTLNLDIERFARDAIIESEGPELVRAFWQAMRDASVLDPTCGSGAFLFAALNILEPLYMAALEGMRGFLDDLQRSGKPHRPEKLRDFREVLDRVEDHPGTRYFILKSIVLNNLYGVDIMEEAVEICKLRLFLKLVAQLRRYDEIEPVPDIDFNIRAGNTLVGFTSLEAVQAAMARTPKGAVRLPFPEEKEALARIEEKAEIANRVFSRFREQQTVLGGSVTAADKAELRAKLARLREELDAWLGKEYGFGAKNVSAYEKWRAGHRPFHWFVEFYGIMARGGFDVIVGNPPYIKLKKIHKSYATRGIRDLRLPRHLRPGRGARRPYVPHRRPDRDDRSAESHVRTRLQAPEGVALPGMRFELVLVVRAHSFRALQFRHTSTQHHPPRTQIPQRASFVHDHPTPPLERSAAISALRDALLQPLRPRGVPEPRSQDRERRPAPGSRVPAEKGLSAQGRTLALPRQSSPALQDECLQLAHVLLRTATSVRSGSPPGSPVKIRNRQVPHRGEPRSEPASR